jgi:hypothetical protein
MTVIEPTEIPSRTIAWTPLPYFSAMRMQRFCL